MKILNYNVAGFRALIKKDNIIDNKKNQINTFSNFVKKNNFDILCLQEIKLNDDNLHILDDYFLEYKYKYVNIPHVKKGYSGVTIISRYEPLKMIDKLIVNGKDEAEGRMVILEFNNFYLVNLYAPNAGVGLKRLDYKNEFNNSLYRLLNNLKKKKEILIVGDFNAIQRPLDDFNYKAHYNKLAGITDDEITFLNKLIDNGYNNAFRTLHGDKIQYSYYSHRTNGRKYKHGILLDYVLATDKLLKKIKKMEYMDNIYGSDHLCIIIELEIKNP